MGVVLALDERGGQRLPTRRRSSTPGTGTACARSWPMTAGSISSPSRSAAARRWGCTSGATRRRTSRSVPCASTASSRSRLMAHAGHAQGRRRRSARELETGSMGQGPAPAGLGHHAAPQALDFTRAGLGTARANGRAWRSSRPPTCPVVRRRPFCTGSYASTSNRSSPTPASTTTAGCLATSSRSCAPI